MATTAVGWIAATPAAAQTAAARRSFDIPAQPLAQALMIFGRQSGLQVTAEGPLTDGVHSSAVKGDMAPAEALSRLLTGTGLTFRFVGSNGVQLERAPQASGDAIQLGPVRVEGNAGTGSAYGSDYNGRDRDDETGTGPVVGYSARRTATATRTDTLIFDLPVSVQVVPRELLDDKQVVTFQKALENVSGVVPNYSGGDLFDSARVRGFFVTAYRDGFRGRSFGRNATSTADIERVEVLKGPASVLYGRAEPGGFINQISKRPLATASYSLQQQIGSFDQYRTTIDATGPLSSDDTLLYRINAEYKNNGSFRDSVKYESVFIAPSLTWNAGENTEVRLALRYFDGDATSDRGLFAVGDKVAPIPIERNLGEPWAVSEWKNYEADLNVSHQISADWNANVRFAYNHFDVYFRGVGFFGGLLDDNRTLLRDAFFNPEKTSTYYGAFDLTGVVRTGSITHNILVGTDYYTEDLDTNFSFVDYGSIDIFEPVRIPPAVPATFTSLVSNVKYHGLYFQDQIDVSESFHLLAGGRYDWAVTKSQFGGSPATETKDSEFSPRLGLVYQPTPWLSLYGSWVNSFGAANAGRSRTGQTFKPETGRQYEAGIKTALFDGRLNATLAAFHLTKQNVLTTDPVNPDFSIQIGEARSKGIEFDLGGEISPGWSTIITYAYTDGKITRSNGGDQGNRLEDLAKHSGSIWTRYEVQNGPLRGLRAGGGVYFVGKRQGDTSNSFQLPGYERVDVFAAYSWRIGASTLTAQVNVDNIFDKEYFANSGGRANIIPGAPRTVKGSVRLVF